MNPYEAPKAKLEEVLPAGTLWRDGNLVRMARDSALPERCVVCNEAAAQRVARTVYWSSAAWRSFSALAPFAMVLAGVALDQPILAALFWPMLLVLLVIHFIIRKKLKLELPVCERHRRHRNILRALSVAALLGTGLILVNLGADLWPLLVAAVALIIALALVQSYIGVQAVSLRRLDAQHAWLGGTGKAFRQALPELPGA